jgi:hypothetical protein
MIEQVVDTGPSAGNIIRLVEVERRPSVVSFSALV